MACACRVNEELSRLQREYGVGKQREEAIDWKSVGKKALLAPVVILGAIPITFMVVMGALKKKPINIGKTFGLGNK